MDIPTFEECELAVKNGAPSPLQTFIYNNEPCNAREFRDQLAELLDYVLKGTEIDDGAYNVSDSD